MSRAWWASALAFLCSATGAEAHRLEVYASAAGSRVEGRAYYPPDQPAVGAEVEVRGPDGRVLHTTKADADGRFAFEARFLCDHEILVDADGLHLARHVLPVGELSPSLPPLAGSSLPPSGPSPPSDLDRKLDAAIARQLRPLREQIDRLETSTRLRDLIGGVGYLVGIAGLIAFLKRKETGRESSPAEVG